MDDDCKKREKISLVRANIQLLTWDGTCLIELMVTKSVQLRDYIQEENKKW